MSQFRTIRLGLGVALLTLAGCETPAREAPAQPGVLYRQLLRTLYRGTVPTVPVAALALELRQPQPPLLLDVRTAAEFRVSHLAGARFVAYDSIAHATFADLDRATPVVVYCSMGVRSERLGERLHALGFGRVRNLYGGLFEWVNEGQPVENAAGPTLDVHPYSTFWGSWLRRGHKAYEPTEPNIERPASR